MLCAALAAAVLTACTPEAAPTPTPTPHFTSDQQAYAAAEQTYRNYVDAINGVDMSDPATFEDVYMWATGDARDSDKKNLSSFHAEGVSITGDSKIKLIEPASADLAAQTVEIYVCLDVSAVKVFDKSGNSLVAEDRPDVQQNVISFEASAASPTGLLVARSKGRTEGPQC